MQDRFRAGDELVLKEIFEEHAPLITGLSRKLVGDDADDLVQVVFISAWKGREKFDPARGSLRGWLCGITRYRAIDMLRTKSRGDATAVANIEILDQAQTMTSEIENVVDSVIVSEALKELPKVKKEVIELRYMSQMSDSEIAEKTNLPLGTVKSHLRRGLDLLEAELGGSHVKFRT